MFTFPCFVSIDFECFTSNLALLEGNMFSVHTIDCKSLQHSLAYFGAPYTSLANSW